MLEFTCYDSHAAGKTYAFCCWNTGKTYIKRAFWAGILNHIWLDTLWRYPWSVGDNDREEYSFMVVFVFLLSKCIICGGVDVNYTLYIDSSKWLSQESLFTQSFSFPKASLEVPGQSKSTCICKSSLKRCVTVFKRTIIWYKSFKKVRKTKSIEYCL